MKTRTEALMPLDDAARTLTQSLFCQPYGTLGSQMKASWTSDDDLLLWPMTSRVLLANWLPQRAWILWLSQLASHFQALCDHPSCSVMVSTPLQPDENPMNAARMTVFCKAQRMALDDPRRLDAKNTFLSQHPKAKIYADFADFDLFVLSWQHGWLNGGFGRAFELSKEVIATL